MRTSRSQPAGRPTSLTISGAESKYETRSPISPLMNVNRSTASHHRLDQHDVIAPQRLMLGQVRCAPGLGEPLGEPSGEVLVNLIDGHGTKI